MKTILAGLAALLCWCSAHGQTWPSKPIRYIVPFAPGGTTDILGRMVATGLASAIPHFGKVVRQSGAQAD